MDYYSAIKKKDFVFCPMEENSRAYIPMFPLLKIKRSKRNKKTNSAPLNQFGHLSKRLLLGYFLPPHAMPLLLALQSCEKVHPALLK